MLRKRWLIWLVVFLAVLGLGSALASMQAHAVFAQAKQQSLSWEDVDARLNAARWMIGLTVAAAALWAGWGVWVKRRQPWAKWAAGALIGTVVVLLLTGVWPFPVFIDTPWPLRMGIMAGRFGLARLGHRDLALGIAGIWVMTVAFFAGLGLIRLILVPGHPILGVARTLVDEAIRMKIALVFIALLIIAVPLLPAVLDPTERLTYRIQSFLYWSLTITGLMLGLMTIFLAVGTITAEIRQHQIFLTMTKPVGRAQYLLGKWLGISLLNLLLVAIAGGSIYLLTQIIREQPAINRYDNLAVASQVLVARETVQPAMPQGMDLGELFNARLRELQEKEKGRYGEPGSPASPAARQEIQNQIIAKWHSVEPRGTSTFRFTGLNDAKRFGRVVQLRVRPKSSPVPPDNRVLLAVWLNGRPLANQDGEPLFPLLVNESQVIDIPLAATDEAGNLDVRLANFTLPIMNDQQVGSVTFAPGEGLELLYQVASFESNLVKTLAMMWFNLVFLAILGLAAGTFLGFPVACVLSLLVFVAASASGFLIESLSNYGGTVAAGEGAMASSGFLTDLRLSFTQGEYYNVFKLVSRFIGGVFVTLIPKLGQYDPISLVSDGRHVSRQLFLGAAFWVFLVWSGLCGLLAWVIFRRRELARVTV